MFHAVNCLLGWLQSSQMIIINQAQQEHVMSFYVTTVLTYWPIDLIAFILTRTKPCLCQGCHAQVHKKCQTTCKKMPNRFKKWQTSWIRPKTVGFDISRWIIWQKHSGTREQRTNAYKATNNYCTLEKTNRIKPETLFCIFHGTCKKLSSVNNGAEIITIRFASWISGRIVSLQPDTDIQKLLSNGNLIRIRIFETPLSMFRGFTLLEKVTHCTINHSLSSEASFQPSVPWLQVCLWCNLCIVM